MSRPRRSTSRLHLCAAALALALAGTGSAQTAGPLRWVEIGSIGSPGHASQLLYSSEYRKLVLRRGESAVVVLDLDDGSTRTFASHTRFTDMSLTPSGRYVFVADYGGENIGYGTPRTPSYVSRLDLATNTFESKGGGNAVAYHIESVDDTHFVLTSWDQWIDFTYGRWGSGSEIDAQTPPGGYFPGVFYGDIEYDRTMGRLIHGNSHLSSQEITAFRISGNTFTELESSGSYGVAQGHGGTCVLAVDGSRFYYGRLQVDALDVSHGLRVFPEPIHAANGRIAIAADAYYDAATGIALGSLGFSTTVFAANRHGNDFWAYDPRGERLRHYSASDEAPPTGLGAYADHARTVLEHEVEIDVLANDFGFDSPVTVSIAMPPGHGVAVVEGSPGEASAIRVRYVPEDGFVGEDAFVYTVSDGATTDSANVAIAVDSFVARADSFVIARSAYSSSLFVGRNDQGFAGPVTITIVREPLHGYTSSGHAGSAQDAYISYSPSYGGPAGDYTDSFTYQISDGVHTDTASVSLEVYALKAVDDGATTPVATPVTIDVLANDIRGYEPVTTGLFETARHGSVRVTGSKMTYTPWNRFAGTDRFIYAIDDGTRVSFGTVTVTVIHDADADGVADEVDNCPWEPNPDQRDADRDGYGSLCDADLNGDAMVNYLDLALFRQRFGGADSDADFDGDGSVDFADLERLRSLFLVAPGTPPFPVPEPGPGAAGLAAVAALALRALRRWPTMCQRRSDRPRMV